MAHLYRDLSVKSLYTDRNCEGGRERWQEAIEESTTLYIGAPHCRLRSPPRIQRTRAPDPARAPPASGNLSFYTTEEQLYEFFSKTGEVRRVVMGLDRFSKTPCGFCFIEFYRRPDTEDAVRFLNGMKLDERVARVDWDGGFLEGRQYGRGRSGGQVRDEYRSDFDAGRGGWGKVADAPPSDRAPLPPPRRGSEHGVRGEGRRDDRGGGPPPPPRGESQPDADEFGREVRPRGGDEGRGDAKRSRAVDEPAEANPRFREDKADSDDED